MNLKLFVIILAVALGATPTTPNPLRNNPITTIAATATMVSGIATIKSAYNAYAQMCNKAGTIPDKKGFLKFLSTLFFTNKNEELRSFAQDALAANSFLKGSILATKLLGGSIALGICADLMTKSSSKTVTGQVTQTEENQSVVQVSAETQTDFKDSLTPACQTTQTEEEQPNTNPVAPITQQSKTIMSPSASPSPKRPTKSASKKPKRQSITQEEFQRRPKTSDLIERLSSQMRAISLTIEKSLDTTKGNELENDDSAWQSTHSDTDSEPEVVVELHDQSLDEQGTPEITSDATRATSPGVNRTPTPSPKRDYHETLNLVGTVIDTEFEQENATLEISAATAEFNRATRENPTIAWTKAEEKKRQEFENAVKLQQAATQKLNATKSKLARQRADLEKLVLEATKKGTAKQKEQTKKALNDYKAMFLQPSRIDPYLAQTICDELERLSQLLGPDPVRTTPERPSERQD